MNLIQSLTSPNLTRQFQVGMHTFAESKLEDETAGNSYVELCFIATYFFLISLIITGIYIGIFRGIETPITSFFIDGYFM
jgi:hypothetical protein